MGEGIGVEFENKSEKFYEDFITIGGKHYKLDQTLIDFDRDDLLKTHTFKTIPD